MKKSIVQFRGMITVSTADTGDVVNTLTEALGSFIADASGANARITFETTPITEEGIQ